MMIKWICYSLEFVEFILLCRLVIGKKFAKPSIWRLFGYVGIFALSITACLDIRIFILMPFMLAYAIAVCFQMTAKEWLKTWLLALISVSFMELIFSYLLENYLNLANNEIRGSLCEIIIIFLIVLYHFIMRKYFTNIKLHIPFITMVWLMIVVCILLILLMLHYFSQLLPQIQSGAPKHNGTIIILLGSISIGILFFILIYYLNRVEKYRIQNQLSDTYREQQKEYFTKLLMKEENTKQFRHDIMNHLVVLAEMAENNKCGQITEYLKKLLKDINTISHMQYDVGNETINIVINYYFAEMNKQCRIEVHGYIDETLQISQPDLCVLISNLAKNAVESIMSIDEVTKREIIFSVKRGTQFFSIKMENTIKGIVSFNKIDLPITKKKDDWNHGIGLKNVKKVVETYQGQYKFQQKNNRFIAEIYLPL